MNRRMLANWELRLGPTQMVALLGAVMGALACAFILGFHSGRSAGFEVALSTTAKEAAKFPVPRDNPAIGADAPAGDSALEEVYARLNDSLPHEHAAGEQAPHKADAKSAVVPLEAIKTTQEAPIIDIGADSALEAEMQAVEVPEAAPELKQPTTIEKELDSLARVVTGSARDDSDSRIKVTTLGESFEQEHDSDKPAAATKKAAGSPSSNSQGSAVYSLSQPEGTTAAATSKPAVEKINPKEANAANPKPAVTTSAPKKALVVDQKPSSPQSVIGNGWYAQVAAPQRLADAQNLTKNLKKAGFKVVIENANVRGQQYYRVLVGPDESRQQAEQLVRQLKRESAISGEPFLRLIK
jgi:cell division protein FtsN